MKLVVIMLAACSASGSHVAPPPSSPETGPRLVVLLVIDQFPEWSFELKRPELRRGFARLLADGEWHVGRYPSAATETGPDHALLSTGEPPVRSGILASRWWHRDLGKTIGASEDEGGHVSAKWLRVPGLGDAIATAHTGAKAVAVSLKDRAAVLALGHHGLAIYYNANTGRFVSNELAPAWLPARKPIGVPPAWTPLDGTAARAGVPDDRRGEVGMKGFGPTFPHDPRTTKAPLAAVFAMPYGDDIVLDMALAAIDGEQLGADRTPDLLVVSLSAHDYIAHGWGHESQEAWDSELRLDAKLDEFLAALDRKVGEGRWAMVVTSDHGGAPLPESVGGGRYNEEKLRLAANQAASAVLGNGEWVASAHYPTLYLTKAARAQDPKELKNAMKKIVFALRAFPGLARVDYVDAVAGDCDRKTGEDRTLCRAFDPERSGEIFYLPASGWIMEEDGEPIATGHGSMNDYDLLVPLIFMPYGRARHAAPSAPLDTVDMTSVASLLARWLGVTLLPTSRAASAAAAP